MIASANNSRRRPGVIRDAIVAFLDERGSAATVGEIERAVTARLGESVSPSSVRSYLRLNTPSMFARVAEGLYALKSPEPVLPTPKPSSQVIRACVWRGTTLYQADCFDWLAQRAPQSIHGVVTDPPYGVVEYTKVEQQKLHARKGGVWRIPPSFDGHVRSPLPRFTILDTEQIGQLRAFFRRWAELLFPVLVPGAHVTVAANPLLSHIVSHELAAAGLERRGEIIRLTMTMRGGDRPKNAHEEFSGVSVMPRSMWEPWLLFRKPVEGRVQDNLRKWKTGGLRRPSADRPFGDVIRSAPTRATERALAPHPSLKPQAFLRQVCHAILPLGEGIVLDPFAGAGSTLAACEAVGYEAIGIELDPRYVEVAKSAIPKLTALAVNAQSA
jgi:site-specific DNA-methyltransferase (adenine-specific)